MSWFVRVQLLVLVVVVVLVAAVLAGCGEAEQEAERPAAAAWERLPAPPLSPREGALALQLEGELLFVGGSDADPCPPNAGCMVPTDPPLRDGAAFDPERRTWRPIAPAPVGMGFSEGVVVGGAAYLFSNGVPERPGAARAFLRYLSAEDDWEKLPLPPGSGYWSIAAAGDRVVAFSGTDEQGEIPDLVFDPATRKWSELPDDPLPRSFDRTMAWSGSELVLFAHELVPNPGASEPSVLIAAALDLDGGAWRRLPDSEILGHGARWFELDGRLILPALGSSDGGEVGNWGRPYPHGGVLDPELGEWSDLPGPPAGVDPMEGATFGAGIVAGEEADYFGQRGWILDADAQEWLEIPSLDDDEPLITGRSVGAAGLQMVAFGGARWDDAGMRGELLDEAWVWSPER